MAWPDTEWTGELDRIAHAASRGDDDIYGEIWLYYMRYKPTTKTGAWRCAKWSRLNWWRREKQRTHERLNENYEG